MYAAREGPHSPRTAQAECGPTLLLFLGGHLGSLQSWWVQIFCNSIRQKKTRVLPCKAPGLSQDYFNFACFEGSGECLANLWQSWKAGVLVMHQNCKIMLPAFHVHSKSSLPLHPRRDGIIRNFLKLPLLFFLSSFLTLTSKKKDHTIKRSLGFYFQIPFSMDRTKNQWNNQASHPIMQQMVKLFVSVNCGFHSSEGCFPPGDSSNWTNWSVFWQVITAQKTHLWNYILVASSKVNWNLGITAHLGNYYAFICYENIAWVFL